MLPRYITIVLSRDRHGVPVLCISRGITLLAMFLVHQFLIEYPHGMSRGAFPFVHVHCLNVFFASFFFDFLFLSFLLYNSFFARADNSEQSAPLTSAFSLLER